MTKKRIVKKWADAEKLAVENILLKGKIKDTRILEMSEAHFKKQSEYWRLQCCDVIDQLSYSKSELVRLELRYMSIENTVEKVIDRYTEEIGIPLNFFKKRRLIKERKIFFLLKKAFIDSKATQGE